MLHCNLLYIHFSLKIVSMAGAYPIGLHPDYRIPALAKNIRLG
jgi:hypothetical protein